MMQNPAVKYGVYLGAFSVVLTMILYFIDKPLLFNPFILPGILFVASIICMVMAAKGEREADADGLLSYGDAVRVTFIVTVIGSVILALFNYLLINVVDPGLLEVMKESSEQMVESILSITGNEELTEEARAELEQQPMSYGFGLVLVDIIGSLITGIIKALLVAIFVKKSS